MKKFWNMKRGKLYFLFTININKFYCKTYVETVPKDYNVLIISWGSDLWWLNMAMQALIISLGNWPSVWVFIDSGQLQNPLIKQTGKLKKIIMVLVG